jgi:hypothetical protein
MPGKIDLSQITSDFADALAAADGRSICHKSFRPGIGPFGEAQAIRLAVEHLKERRPDYYARTQIKRTPDVLVPDEWAIEVKLVRPFGDNGKLAEHWSENVLHPYPGNTSSIGDCLKLINSGLKESKAIIIIGYEHENVQVSLDPAIKGFEILCREVAGIKLGTRIEQKREKLIHPVHQVLKISSYEVLGGY